VHVSDRRKFLHQTLTFGSLALANTVGAAEAGQTSPLQRMSWLNEPRKWRIDGDRLLVESTPKADFYRLPGWTINNGNFFRLSVSGDFIFQARISGEYLAKYDQAGLMVRLDDENWLKCGSELVDGQRLASAVITRTYSDWSTMPDLSQSAPVWWQVVRWQQTLKALCSIDGKSFATVREGYFPAARSLEVGLLCCSLEGAGVKASFDSLSLSSLKPGA
jgi:regulation of enolase protein 1 (concanavalin A-like superfamily)